MTEIRARITPYQKTAAELAAENDVPLQGERVRATDTGREKTGDGTTHYNDLPYDDDPARIHGSTAAGRAILTGNLFLQLARTPEQIIVGAITRDANGAATGAAVVWPDGTPGIYTATTVSTAFPGAVDAYTITYGSPVTATYTQAAVTRDPTTGAATTVPAITVS